MHICAFCLLVPRSFFLSLSLSLCLSLSLSLSIYLYIYIQCVRQIARGLRKSWWPPMPPLGAKLACPPGLPGLPGPQYCLPRPQYCLSWPSGRQLDANWTPIGRQVDAKWTPSERQVGLPRRLPVSTHVLRTPKRLSRSTERLANSTVVAV